MSEEADKMIFEDLLSKISPVEMLNSYLSIIVNTPENGKEMIRKRLFHTLRKGDLLERFQTISNISRKQSFDLSTIHKRHSFVSNQAFNKRLSVALPNVYNNNTFKVKVQKIKTIIKQPKFEIIPFNLRSMEQYLNKVTKDPTYSIEK